jgi:hypothetical protein
MDLAVKLSVAAGWLRGAGKYLSQKVRTEERMFEVGPSKLYPLFGLVYRHFSYISQL